MMIKTKISVIIPCYYSEKSIYEVVTTTIEEFNRIEKYDYEFILVNDGSEDKTFDVICQLSKRYSFVTGIDLSKNFGQHNAIIAGMKYANGDYILGMDDDMQTHPSQIYKLINKIEEGYDIVYGKFSNRKHSHTRNIFSILSTKSADYLLDNPKGLKACPMYIIRKFIKDEIIKSNSSFTNLRGLFLRTTSRITNVEIQHFDRKNGKSGYTLKKLFKLWSSYLNYTIKPVSLIRKSGVLLFFTGILYLVFSLIFSLEIINTLISVIIISTGLVVLSLGIIGEYVIRTFMVNTNEPQYVIRKISKGNDDEKNIDTRGW